MPSEEETEVRTNIERQLHLLGRGPLGKPKYEPAGLSIDWVYEDAQPPFALEVTSTRAEEEEAGRSRCRKLERDINRRLAESDSSSGLGWHAIVRETADLDVLEERLVQLIKEGRELDGYAPGNRELRSLGVLLLHRIPLGRNFAVSGLTDTVKVNVDLTPDLEQAIHANAAKLQPARPMSTHLAVVVHRRDVLRDPAHVAVPRLADSIDVLWVWHRRARPDNADLWWASRGDSKWRTARTPAR